MPRSKTHCYRVKVPGTDTVAIVRGQMGEPCIKCGGIGGYLCDYPMPNDKTCDASMCADHRTIVGDDKDHCIFHDRIDAKHLCHWPRCQVEVPPKMWGCRTHWFRLPKYLRDSIWIVYRPGQEVDKQPSADYLQVAADVQAWISEHGGIEDA